MPSSTSLLKALRKRPSPEETLALLTRLSGMSLNPKELLAYHEALLFGKAYPRSLSLRRFCERELALFADRVRKLRKGEFVELDQSSIAGTRVNYPYDEPMAKWLANKLGGHIEMDWDAYEARNDDPLSDHMSLLMELAEGDAVDSSDISVRELVEAARGNETALEWLLKRFEAAFPEPELRQQIYDAMNIPVAMTLVPPRPSRTLLEDGRPKKLFLWDPVAARAKFDLTREIKRPLRIPLPVTPARGRELLDLTYGSLLVRMRELYPATHCNVSEVYDIALHRGFRVIFFFMTPDYRLPLEAGWGYLVLKNNVPVGYGAGGMVADQSEVSINVFDTFRGGEAAWLYSQYARICYQLCKAPWLITRKWQLGGEGNEEGLESGSFWFYDKLGFESVEPELRKIADRERKKIAAGTGYRCPRRVLLQLAQADVVLNINGRPVTEYRPYPLGQAGLAATRVITEQFGGNRDHLQERILNEMKRRFGVTYTGWTRDEKSRFTQMSLFVLAVPNTERWPGAEQKALLALCRAKGSVKEADYASLMPKNRRFFEELRKLASE